MPARGQRQCNPHDPDMANRQIVAAQPGDPTAQPVAHLRHPFTCWRGKIPSPVFDMSKPACGIVMQVLAVLTFPLAPVHLHQGRFGAGRLSGDEFGRLAGAGKRA